MKSRSFMIGVCSMCAKLYDECTCPEAERRKQQFELRRSTRKPTRPKRGDSRGK